MISAYRAAVVARRIPAKMTGCRQRHFRRQAAPYKAFSDIFAFDDVSLARPRRRFATTVADDMPASKHAFGAATPNAFMKRYLDRLRDQYNVRRMRAMPQYQHSHELITTIYVPAPTPTPQGKLKVAARWKARNNAASEFRQRSWRFQSSYFARRIKTGIYTRCLCRRRNIVYYHSSRELYRPYIYACGLQAIALYRAHFR